MARSQSRLTAEIDFDRDGKQHGFIRLPYSVHRSAYGWIPIPVACIKNGEEPHVLLMAGNHGDEYEGQVALGKLIRALEPAEVRGRIIILPSANFPAAMAGTRTSPLDDGNLNRSFPGDAYGGPTAQIADYIESVLLPQCDFVFDFHSGGSSLTYVPSALMRRGQTPEELNWGIELLRTFGAPVGYLVDGGWGDHTLTAAAARAGVRHMGTEIAGGGQVTPSGLRILEAGIRRILTSAGAVTGGAAPGAATASTTSRTIWRRECASGAVSTPTCGFSIFRQALSARIHHLLTVMTLGKCIYAAESSCPCPRFQRANISSVRSVRLALSAGRP